MNRRDVVTRLSAVALAPVVLFSPKAAPKPTPNTAITYAAFSDAVDQTIAAFAATRRTL